MLYSTVVWTELKFYTLFWGADFKKKIIGETSEEKQRNSKRIKGLKKKAFDKRLSELGLFILQPKKTEKS